MRRATTPTTTPKLPQLSLDYLFKINPSTYGRASVGLLERMFGGVGGEVLWKPVDQSWGVGADVNWVAQRDYDDPFGFDYYNYDVVTGHRVAVLGHRASTTSRRSSTPGGISPATGAAR